MRFGLFIAPPGSNIWDGVVCGDFPHCGSPGEVVLEWQVLCHHGSPLCPGAVSGVFLQILRTFSLGLAQEQQLLTPAGISQCLQVVIAETTESL